MEDIVFMPNKENKDQWKGLVARYITMCYGCGENIRPGNVIMNNRTYKVSMHIACYTKHIKGEVDAED